MEMAVEQHCAEKTKFQTKMENILKENDCLLTNALSVEIVNIVVNDCMNRDTVSSSESAPTFAELFETNELKAQIQEKDTMILKLKEKIKSSSGDVKERKVENLQTTFYSIKSSRVQSKEQCDDLINKVNLKSVEVADLNVSLRENVLVITALKEQLKGKAVLPKAVSLNPIDPALLQVDVVLLVPKLHKNRTAHIDYIKHTLKEAAILKELVESKRLLSPLNTPLAYACKYIGVALVSSASASQSKDNTKINRIRRTHKKAKETELEDHSMKVKSSLNKASVVDSRANSSVIKSISIVNSNLKCASYNGCLFFDNHDTCVVEYINSVNASRKSKSVKKLVKRQVWKTTGKVFKTVRYIWQPTGRTLTLVGNVCPLTRITTATIVPLREPIPIVKSTDKPVVTLVYTRKPKAKNVPNKMEPNKSWGSSSTVSSPITDCR
nr:hypothetical protein [Tanacetum cinerariifolium]